jgi:hypothetical protein
LAHAFLCEYGYERLKLVQLLLEPTWHFFLTWPQAAWFLWLAAHITHDCDRAGVPTAAAAPAAAAAAVAAAPAPDGGVTSSASSRGRAGAGAPPRALRCWALRCWASPRCWAA